MSRNLTLVATLFVVAAAVVAPPLLAQSPTNQAVQPPPLANGEATSAPPAAKPPRDPGFDYRRHWSAVRSDGTPFYEVTTIVAGTEDLATRTALLRDWRGETWQLDEVHDFGRQVVRKDIRHVPTGEFVRFSYKAPMKARTRLEAFAEVHSGTMKFPDEIITIETRSVSRTAANSEWKNLELSADWRTDIRTSLSTLFTDSIERMKATLFVHDPDLAPLGGMVQLLMHSPECESQPYSKVVENWPDCAFDKALGKPCSEKQLERVERAQKKGIQLHRY